MRRILVMGLSGNGKTWLASRMSKLLHIPHWDADVVREIYKDWDFSEGGRIRQAYRMNSLASKDSFSVSSFICPTEEHRRIFDPEIILTFFVYIHPDCNLWVKYSSMFFSRTNERTNTKTIFRC